MKQGKYLFPSFEKAKEMKDDLISTEENPCKHTAHGLKPEMTKAVYEKIIVADEVTGEEIEVDNKDVVLEESEPTGRWQLDVFWVFSEDEEIDHPYGWKKYALDLDSEGNNRIIGRKYLNDKL